MTGSFVLRHTCICRIYVPAKSVASQPTQIDKHSVNMPVMHAMYDLGIIMMDTSWHEADQSITIEDCDWTCLHRVFHFADLFSGHKKLIHALQQSMAEQKQQARARVIHGRAFFGIQKFLGSLSAQPSVWGQFLSFDVDCTTLLGTVCSYRTKYL